MGDLNAVTPVPRPTRKRRARPAAESHVEALEAENARLRARVRELERADESDRCEALAQFADTTDGWFWEMDEALRFTYFSPSVKRVTGVEPEWHYGKTREDLGRGTGVSEQQWREHLETLRQRQPFSDFVFRRAGPDGVKWMKTSGVPIHDGGGVFRGYRGTATDITAEITARRTADRLRAAVENLEELFVLWDADDGLVVCNARFREINAAVAHTLVPGTTFEEHIRAALAAGLYPNGVGREQQWLAQRLAQHQSPGEPFELERQDGRCLLVREQRLSDGSTATVATDVSPLKQAMARLSREHDLLQHVVSHSPVILWAVDREGIIEVSDGVGLSAQGYGSGDLVGSSIFDVYQENPDFLANVRRALAGEAFSAQNETGNATFERWFEPVLDERGTVTGVIGVSVDVSERTRSEKIRMQQHDVLQTTLATIPDGVQVLDGELNLVAWNERLWEVMELDGPAIVNAPDPGKAFRYALAARGEYGDGDVDELVASREAIARTTVPVHYERQLVSGKWIECRGTPLPGGGYLAVYRDVHESRQMQEQLERFATRDDLTGLANRRSFLEALERELGRARRHGRVMCVAIVDVDHFKTVNDRHGHAAGDHVLCRISEAMRGAVRDTDIVGRLGGEEFALLLPECPMSGGAQVCERLREAVAAMRHEFDAASIQVTVSVGVAESTRGCDSKSLIANADGAVYAAKRGGRNRVILHDNEATRGTL